MNKVLVLLTVFIFLPVSLFAILPPQVLQKEAMNANEVIKIKVIDVKVVKTDKYHFSIKTKVKVLEIKKSASSLKKGDIITIEYTRRELKEKTTGPRPNPFLSENEITGAFLYKNKDGNYGISARSASFNDTYYKNYVITKDSGVKLKDKRIKKIKKVKKSKK